MVAREELMDEELDLQLKELIIERLFLDLEAEDIDADTPLSEYGIDSFLLLEMIVAIEELFSLRFEPEDITSEALQSVSALRELAKAKQGGGADH